METVLADALIATLVIGGIGFVVLFNRAATAEAKARLYASRRGDLADVTAHHAAARRAAEARAGELAGQLRAAEQRIDSLVVSLERAEQPEPEPEALTPEQRETLLQNRCGHCGGVHAISCPRVKRLRFRPDGQTPAEVEFFPDDQWPKDRIKWIEDLPPVTALVPVET